MNVQLAAVDEDSIAQCIRTILLTNKGDIPFKPNMGVGSNLLLDTNADRLKMSLEITTQLNTYEPRIRVKQVLFMQGENVGHLKIAIKYNNKSTGLAAAYFYNN